MWDTATGQPIGQPLAPRRHGDQRGVQPRRHPHRLRPATTRQSGCGMPARGREIGVLTGHESPAMAVAFSPDGLHLVSSAATNRPSGCGSQQLAAHARPHRRGCGPRYFDDGRRIGSGGEDKTVRWWDAATGRPIGQPLRVNNDDVKRLYPVDENRLVSFGTVDTMRSCGTAQANPSANHCVSRPIRPVHRYLTAQ